VVMGEVMKYGENAWGAAGGRDLLGGVCILLNPVLTRCCLVVILVCMIKNELKFTGRAVPVELGPRSYPIYVGSEVLAQFGRGFRQHCKSRLAVIITDENVGPIYSEIVSQSLKEANVESHLITVPAGEPSKRMAVVETIYDKLFDFSVERSDSIVALGGGVVGDLAGFVAATFKRGVNFVQVPTSLLAMVDSSVGGKTGINHPRGKNMIGSFYQPKMVFADTVALRTLPKRELGCGLAETVKHSVIRDREFFEYLQTNRSSIMELQQDLMVDLVERNCRIKAEVVSADERESGLRRILNYGHTIGHTFETVLKDQDYHHGEAVSLGIVAANCLAVSRKLITKAVADKISQLLQSFNLPISVNKDLPIDKLYTAMRQDKKVKAGKIVFVLPTKISQTTFVDDFAADDIKNAIKLLMK